MQWIEESERRFQELEESYLQQCELLAEVKRWRDRILRKEVQRVELAEGDDPSVSYVAVDSAFMRARYLHADVCVAVAVAVSERGYVDDRVQMLIETKGLVEEDEERNRVYLEGLALSLEVELANRLAPDYRMVFLDGSLHTFYTKFNSAFRAAKRAAKEGGIDAPLVRLLNESFSDTSRYFLALLERHPTVAVPKLFGFGDIYSAIDWEELLKVLQRLKASEQHINPYLLLDALLEPGEYIEIPPEELETKAWTYPDEGPEGKRLQRAMQRRAVCYMKGLSGRVFKFETTKYFDHSFLYIFTAGGKELLPLKLADELAKGLLKAVKRKTMWEEYR